MPSPVPIEDLRAECPHQTKWEYDPKRSQFAQRCWRCGEVVNTVTVEALRSAPVDSHLYRLAMRMDLL